MNYNIAVIPGDGIGPEVTEAAVTALKIIGERYSHSFVFTETLAGGAAIDACGEPLPKECLDICRKSDAVLLGAVGGDKWDNLSGNIRPEQAILGLRGELNLYANLRPAVLYRELMRTCPLKPAVAERGIDIMIVRELTGGIYFGERGKKGAGADEFAWDTEKYSYNEVRRIAKTAFETAMKRKKSLVSVDKANVLESSRLWRRVVIETAKEYPDVSLSHMYVDNASMQLIKAPDSFDVIVTTNMFGDILSDEASQLTGSIGMLPSASIGGGGFGLYEPIHGSAPDIAGQDKANPIAAVLSAAMMLRHSLGLTDEAAAIESAVKKTLSQGYRTADIYGGEGLLVGTKKIGEIISKNIGL